MSSAVDRSKPFIRACRPGDVEVLGETMRVEDMAEVLFSSGSAPTAALVRSLRASRDAWVIEWRGAPVAMFGIVGIPGSVGSPWMLGTDDLKRCWSLLRECRRRLDEYLTEYHYLTNFVWSKNTVHIEWIKWLGFHFDGSQVRNGQTFLQFHRSKHDV